MSTTLIVGATSQIGRCLLPRLTECGTEVIATTRQPIPELQPGPATWLRLDLDCADDDRAKVTRVETLIHLAPIFTLPGFLARSAPPELTRVLAFSTTSAVTKADSLDFRERLYVERVLEAEAFVQSWCDGQNVAWAIFRPTMIYGLGLDNNVSFIARFIHRCGFFPLVGAGIGKRQPVHAADLASACLAALTSDTAWSRIYHLGGGEVLSYRTMVERIFAALGRKPRFIRLPVPLLRMALSGLRHLRRYDYLSPEMADRIDRDMVFDLGEAAHELSYAPRPFQPTLSELIHGR